MIKYPYWLRLLTPDGEQDGGGESTSAPASSSVESTPSISIETPPDSIPDRSSPITSEVAEKLGLDPTSSRHISVKPMAALGLGEAPSSALKQLVEKENLKVTKAPVFTKPGQTAAPGVITNKIPTDKTPAVTLPTTPAVKPVVTQQPATPQASIPAPAVQKFNIGGKEMTAEQMAAYIEGQNAAMRQPQQVPAPVNQTPGQPQRTPEQQVQYVKERETAFVAQTAPHIDLSLSHQMTPEQMDVIAAGGPEALAVMNQVRQKDVALATLLARKTIAQEMNPILARTEDVMRQQAAMIQPIIQREQEVAAWETEQDFVKGYPDLVPHIETARVVGRELARAYPQWAATVSRADFVKAVAEQTPAVLAKFGVTIGKAQAAAQSPQNAPGSPKPVQTVKSTGTPKPVTGQAPSARSAAVTKPAQTQGGFQKVAVSSISALR